MKKEILLRVIIEGNQIASVIQKIGFDDNLSSSFEIIGVLQKIITDEEEKINKKLKVSTDLSIKEPITKKDGDEFFFV